MQDLHYYQQQFLQHQQVLTNLLSQSGQTQQIAKLNSLIKQSTHCIVICNTIQNCSNPDYAYELWGEVNSYILDCNQEVTRILNSSCLN